MNIKCATSRSANKNEQQQQYQDHIRQKFSLRGKCKRKIHNTQ